MPELTLYHLNPQSAFHFGQRGIEQESTGVYLPSDSLFSALLSTWLEFGGSPDVLTDRFPHYEPANEARGLPFLITSLFPRAGGVRFYPPVALSRLLSQEKLDGLHRENRLKEVKKIRFISESLFKAVTAGQTLDRWVPAERTPQPADQGVYIQGSALWLTHDEIEKLPAAMQTSKSTGDPLKALRQANVWRVGKAPRVTVDRASNASQIFHTGRLQMSADCGFWFGVHWQQPDQPAPGTDKSFKQIFDRIMNLLVDAGLGAERNAGYGHFTYEEAGSLTYPDPQPAGLFVTLSRYHPHDTDLPLVIEHPRSTYTLTSVAGWLHSPQEAAQRRQRVWLFEEGSVLRMPDHGVVGNLVDVRPRYNGSEFPHPVWRYGLALPVGVAAASEKEGATP